MINKNICEHDWNYHTDVGVNINSGYTPATVICRKCHSNISLSDKLQLDNIKDIKDDTKKTSLRSWISIIISTIAIIISILV